MGAESLGGGGRMKIHGIEIVWIFARSRMDFDFP